MLSPKKGLRTRIEVSTSHATWSAPEPKIEARALFQLLGRNGVTVEDIRELIAITAETERHLQAYARANPEERQNIERVLKFRELVGREFEQLYFTQR